MAEYITVLLSIIKEAEKAKGYWDDAGLDMHIAVKKGFNDMGVIAVSTKHWGRVHYLQTTLTDTNKIWNDLGIIAGEIGRTYIKSAKGTYVYLNNLNLHQTQSVFDKFKEKFGNNIKRGFPGFGWDIDSAVLPTR
jgi:hypothetical protein